MDTERRKGWIAPTVGKLNVCLFDWTLNIPVKRYGHVGMLPSFYGTFIQN